MLEDTLVIWGRVRTHADVTGSEVEDRAERVVAAGGRVLEGISQLREAVGDQRCLESLLVGEVLVERRRADAKTLREPSHRQALQSLLLELLPGDSDDLGRAAAQSFTSAGSHRESEDRNRAPGRG